MNLPIVIEHQTRHGEDCPKNRFFKVHLRSLNNEVFVLQRGHNRLVSMDCNAKCAKPLTQSF